MTTSVAVIRNPAYADDGSEVLISKVTWTLKFSGLVFAGLLIVGRSASYGNVTWTPTFHPAESPLIVQSTGHSNPVPGQTKNKGVDPAALSKRSAAAEIVVFNPGNSAGGEGDQPSRSGPQGDKAHSDDHDSDANGSGQTAAGSGHGSANGATTATETSSSAGGSGNGTTNGATATETSTSAGGGSGNGTTNVATTATETSTSMGAGSGNGSSNGATTATETSTSAAGSGNGSTNGAATATETSTSAGGGGTATETKGEVGGAGGGTVAETSGEVGGTTTGGGTTATGAAPQAGTLANTGGGPVLQAGKARLAADGAAAVLLALVAAAWLKRREFFGRWMR